MVAAIVGPAATAGIVGILVMWASNTGGDSSVVGPASEAPAALALGPGEYFYLRVESSTAVDGHVRDEETWWALDGSGQVRNASTRQDKYPYPPSGVYGPDTFPIETDLSALSTDPTELASQLRGDGSFAEWLTGEGDAPLWDVIETILLDFPNAAPDLRAALFEVAADIDGVDVIDAISDPRARDAVALRFANESERATWTEYFDPATHQLIAWTSVYADNEPAWMTFESGIVGSPRTLPTGDQWLFPVGKGTTPVA